jgi:hypothetical protein
MSCPTPRGKSHDRIQCRTLPGQARARAGIPRRAPERQNGLERHPQSEHDQDRERTYCIIAEWDDMADLIAARPKMIATLDTFGDTLEDLGGGLGITDPVSGPVVLALR